MNSRLLNILENHLLQEKDIRQHLLISLIFGLLVELMAQKHSMMFGFSIHNIILGNNWK